MEKDSYEWDIKVVLDDYMMLYLLDILNMNGILDILCLIYIGGLMGKFG